MKKTINFYVFIILILTFSVSGCFKEQPIQSDIPLFSSITDVVNPPDEFQVIYSLNTFNSYLALLEFETDAVWKIERISAPGFITVWIERTIGDNNPELDIINAQNSISFVGLKGGIQYNFWAFKSSGDAAYTTLLLHFTKQNIDFESFTPKV